MTLTQPGVYRIVVDPGQGFTAVTVRIGGAEVAAPGAMFPVSPGQALVLSGGDVLTYDVRVPDPPDGWERSEERRVGKECRL